MREYSNEMLFFAIDEVVLRKTVRELGNLKEGDLKEQAIDLLDATAKDIAEADSNMTDEGVDPESITESRIKDHILWLGQ